MKNRLKTSLTAMVLAVALPTVASAQCPERGQIQELLFDGATAEQLSEEFNGCNQIEPADPKTADAKQNTTPTGSVFWEAIDACGYHPQRRELDCAIEVRQQFGFAGPPGGGPGSWEWVQFCVDYGAGLVPVNLSAVHVHDEPFGFQPPWYYGVSVQADPRLHQTLVNGQTLRARAILSWTLIPTGCNYIPVWGNQADFRIKLDP